MTVVISCNQTGFKKKVKKIVNIFISIKLSFFSDMNHIIN